MIKRRITLLDGAMGTRIWENTEGKLPVWSYNITRPDVVLQLAKEYIEAGAEIILSNTFGANGPEVKRSSNYTTQEVVEAGVRIAREAVKGTKAKVAMSMGPLSQLMEPYGDLTEEETAEIYREMIHAGMKEKPDLFMFETFMDLNMMVVATKVAKEYGIPVFCSMTFEKAGKTIMGNSVQDVVDALEPLGIDAIGLNCSLGPEDAFLIIKEFSEKTNLPLLLKPNAGMPILSDDGTSTGTYDAATFACDIKPSLPYISYLGGCCGTNVSYIKKLKELISRIG